MSILSIDEMYEEQDANKDQEGYSVRRPYRAVSDTINESPITVISGSLSLGLPDVGDTHPLDSSLWVTNITPRLQSPAEYVWNVIVEYRKIPAGGFSPTATGTKPWDRLPVIQYFKVAKSRVLERAYKTEGAWQNTDPALFTAIPGIVNRFNRPVSVLNSADQQFDPPFMVNDYHIGISIDRNTRDADFDSNAILDFLNTVNKDDLQIAGFDCPPFYGYINDIRFRSAYTSDDELYWEEHWEIIINLEGWLVALLDQGIYTTAATPSGFLAYTAIIDSEGDRITDPVLLDGAGQEKPTGADPYYLVYHAYWETEFNNIGLPQNQDGT